MEEQTSPQPVVSSPVPSPEPAPTPPTQATQSVSTAHGINGPMPDELRRWSWAAFLMTWLWGISHNVWISLLSFVPFVNLFIWIYLGIKGNELAWQNRKFESVQQFHEVQKKWTQWGVGLLIVSAFIFIAMFSFIIAAFSGMYGDEIINDNSDYFNSELYQPPTDFQ